MTIRARKNKRLTELPTLFNFKTLFCVSLLFFGFIFLFSGAASVSASTHKHDSVLVNSTSILNDEEIAWLKSHPTITVAFDGNFPPYSYLENGKVNGVALDYFRLIEQKIGVKS